MSYYIFENENGELIKVDKKIFKYENAKVYIKLFKLKNKNFISFFLNPEEDEPDVYVDIVLIEKLNNHFKLSNNNFNKLKENIDVIKKKLYPE